MLRIWWDPGRAILHLVSIHFLGTVCVLGPLGAVPACPQGSLADEAHSLTRREPPALGWDLEHRPVWSQGPCALTYQPSRRLCSTHRGVGTGSRVHLGLTRGSCLASLGLGPHLEKGLYRVAQAQGTWPPDLFHTVPSPSRAWSPSKESSLRPPLAGTVAKQDMGRAHCLALTPLSLFTPGPGPGL